MMQMKGKWCTPHWISWILAMIGALNWGLVGAFNFNLVDSLFGIGSLVSRIIYILVGISAVALIVGCKCKICRRESMPMQSEGIGMSK